MTTPLNPAPGAVNWTTQKLQEALASVPDGPERVAFRQLVEETTWHAMRRGWAPYRAWAVLADLVREGWRPTRAAEVV